MAAWYGARQMPLTEADSRRIKPYVSNLDGNVFALAGLPEEVIAVLFAYYSRSKEDLRTNLAKLLLDQDIDVDTGASAPQFRLATEKARAFHEKWVVGYGHASVAEHAVVHLAIENVSIVVSKLVEDLRLASYTEKSTRYVLWEENSFHALPELDGRSGQLYRDSARALFRTYLELVPRVEREVRERHPRGEKQTEGAYTSQVRAKTFDLLRGLLPAGTRTNLGFTANARAIEMLLSKLLASPLAEAREIATRMHKESAHIAPTLVKYVAPNAYRASLREDLPRLTAAADITGTDEGLITEEYGQAVRLLRYDSDALQRVVHALAYDGSDALWNASGLTASVSRTTSQKLEQLLARALEKRGKFDPAPRAFEATSLTFEVTMDFGAYRDLQRHRMLTPFPQRLTCRLGAEVPPELDDMPGVGDLFRHALERAEETWSELAPRHPWEAQYVVPLAYRLRTMWQMNLRELFHLVELRSAREGHPSYRKVAQQIYKSAAAALPWLRDLVRVDMNEYELTRKG
jgi:thymidylate synthase ThyX